MLTSIEALKQESWNKCEAIAESLVQWSSCRQEVGILEGQLSNCRGQVIELESIAESSSTIPR